MTTAMQDCLKTYMVEISDEDAAKLIEKERLQIQRAFNIGSGDWRHISGAQYYAETYPQFPKIPSTFGKIKLSLKQFFK